MTPTALQPNISQIRTFMPPAQAAPPTVPCSPQAEAHLALMLSGQHSDILSEWLSAFILSGKRLSNAALSSLLKYIQAQAVYWNEIDTIIISHNYPPDEGGHFYMNSYNADHKYSPTHLTTEKIEQVWHTETLNERLMLLDALRTCDPDYARDLLQSTWKAEPLKARARLLGSLNVNLSMADEPFIESALDDRAGAVRRTAVDLLVRLPESRFVSRMIDRVAPLFSYKPSQTESTGHIKVTLPTTYTPAMKRDGIYERSLDYGMDEPSYWLRDMISNIPPQTWPRLWNASALDLVKAANNSTEKKKQILLKGWQDACSNYHDPDWAEAFVQIIYPLAEAEGRAWFEFMRPHKREEVVTRALANEPNVLYTDHVPRKVLSRLETPWSEAFSRFFIARLKHVTDSSRPKDEDIYSILLEIASALAPSTADEAESQLIINHSPNPYYSQDLADLVQTLRFRHDMLEALAN